MPFEFVENGDHTAIRCYDCAKVVSVAYSPFDGPKITVTADIFKKLEKHKCKGQRHRVPEKCKSGDHDLKKIYEDGGDMESSVVRWCIDCGSITIDVDYDGRTKPGEIMKMRSPNISKT